MTYRKVILSLASILICSSCHKNIPMTGGLNNRILFLTVLKVGPFQSKVSVDLVPGGSSRLGLWVADFLLCPHMDFL